MCSLAHLFESSGSLCVSGTFLQCTCYPTVGLCGLDCRSRSAGGWFWLLLPRQLKHQLEEFHIEYKGYGAIESFCLSCFAVMSIYDGNTTANLNFYTVFNILRLLTMLFSVRISTEAQFCSVQKLYCHENEYDSAQKIALKTVCYEEVQML